MRTQLTHRQVRYEKYLSVLGGISIIFSLELSCKRRPVELSCFLAITDSAYDIEANFTYMAESLQNNINILLTQQEYILYKSKEGYQLVCFSEEEKKKINWLVNFDNTFTFFYFSLKKNVSLRDGIDSFLFNRFLLQHTLINHHGLIIHAAGGSINGKGMVFPAVSGTGKSTLSHLLLPHPENQLFSEERIIMRRLDDGWHLWGTPWKGSGVIARNESAPLSALVFLSQAPETKISKLPPSAALRRLLETVSIPWYSQEWTDKGLVICESLLRAIPTYELAFRPDQTAVQAVAELAASLD